MRHGWFTALAMAGPLALSVGCMAREDVGEARADVAEAQQPGAIEIAKAQSEAREDLAAARKEETQSKPGAALANTRHETLRQEAEGRYRVEAAEIAAAYAVDEQRCDAQAGDQRSACLDRARADHDRKLTEARSRLDGTQRGLEENVSRAPRSVC